MSKEADLVQAAIEAAGGRWFAGLAAPLARLRWRSVAELTGLTRQTYGTTRYLAGNGSAPRDDLTTVSLPPAFAATGWWPWRRYMGTRVGATPTWGSNSTLTAQWTSNSSTAASSMRSIGSPKCRPQPRPSEPCWRCYTSRGQRDLSTT